MFMFYRSRSRSPRHRRSDGGHRRRSPDSRSPSPRSKDILAYQFNCQLFFIDHRREEREKPSRRDDNRRRRHSSSENDRSPKQTNRYLRSSFYSISSINSFRKPPTRSPSNERDQSATPNGDNHTEENTEEKRSE